VELDRAGHDLSADVAPGDLRRQARHSSGFLKRFTTAATNWTGRNSAFACATALVIGWLSEEELRTLRDRFVQLSTTAAAGANTARLDVDVATRKAGCSDRSGC
jgi:hypothetical protein